MTTNRVTRIHEYDHSPAATEDKKKEDLYTSGADRIHDRHKQIYI